MTPQKTAEETIGLVAKAMAEQVWPAINRSGQCVYIDHEGRRCAVGCLLSPDLATAAQNYVEEGERDGDVYTLLSRDPPFDVQEALHEFNIGALGFAQEVHDTVAGILRSGEFSRRGVLELWRDVGFTHFGADMKWEQKLVGVLKSGVWRDPFTKALKDLSEPCSEL